MAITHGRPGTYTGGCRCLRCTVAWRKYMKAYYRRHPEQKIKKRLRERARRAGDHAFDPGSINHFALEARDPGEFVRIRASLIQAGRTDETVYDATDLYTVFATDPDGLFIELILRKVTGWDPPFATKPFRGLGQPAVPNA